MDFKIIAEMSSRDNTLLFSGNVKYGQQWTGTDKITISKKTIEISGTRKSNSAIETIEGLYRSKIYMQLIKSIIYLYAITSEPLNIESISVIKNNTPKKYSNINQFFSGNKTYIPTFNKNELKIIFEENEKASSLKDSLFYFLRSIYEDNYYLAFELVWKSFNIIYYCLGGKNSDFDNQKELRTLLLTHESLFIQSKSLVNKLSSKEFRNNFRWRQFVYNDFPKKTSGHKSHANSFHDFILRYNDPRIMDLFNEILCYKEDELKTESLYDDCINYIRHHTHIKNDVELVALIAIKYSYFVRNKLTHGEENDLTYTLLSKDLRLEEIKYITKLLQTLINDLFNSISLL